jgi:hypothetical protein
MQKARNRLNIAPKEWKESLAGADFMDLEFAAQRNAAQVKPELPQRPGQLGRENRK